MAECIEEGQNGGLPASGTEQDHGSMGNDELLGGDKSATADAGETVSDDGGHHDEILCADVDCAYAYNMTPSPSPYLRAVPSLEGLASPYPGMYPQLSQDSSYMPYSSRDSPCTPCPSPYVNVIIGHDGTCSPIPYHDGVVPIQHYEANPYLTQIRYDADRSCSPAPENSVTQQDSVTSLPTSMTTANAAREDASVVEEEEPSQRSSEISLTCSQSVTCGFPASDIVMAGPDVQLNPASLAPYTTSFPIIYVSPAGLLTVLLRHEMAVEMTVDRTIRVVNHKHKAVAATNSRGNSSCVYHTAAKVFQSSTNTDVDIFWGRKAKMSTDNITICSGTTALNLSPLGLHPCGAEFPDLSKDSSVGLLFSSSGYGPNLIPACYEIAQNASYTFHKRGGITVLINGMRIFQNSRGDVMVACGRKYIRSSALNGTLYLETHFVEMAVELNWRIRIKRGGQRLLANFSSFMVSDGISEAGFDPHGQIIYQPVVYVTHTIIDNTKKDAVEGSANDENDMDEEGAEEDAAGGEDKETEMEKETSVVPVSDASDAKRDADDTQVVLDDVKMWYDDTEGAMETRSAQDVSLSSREQNEREDLLVEVTRVNEQESSETLSDANGSGLVGGGSGEPIHTQDNIDTQQQATQSTKAVSTESAASASPS